MHTIKNNYYQPCGGDLYAQPAVEVDSLIAHSYVHYYPLRYYHSWAAEYHLHITHAP